MAENQPAEKPKDEKPKTEQPTDNKEKKDSSDKKEESNKKEDTAKKRAEQIQLLNQKQITESNKKILELDKAINNLGTITGEELPPIDEAKKYENLKFNTRKAEEEYEYPDRSKDWFQKIGLASIVIKAGKAIGLSVGNNTKLGVDSHAINLIAPTVEIKANRLNLNVDEIIINGHKLNNRLFELSDFREIPNKPGSAIGNLQMKGTVLVKAWEPNLNRYVLIRRNIHMPLFSKILNPPEINEGLKIDDPTKLITDFKAFSKEMLAGNMPAKSDEIKKSLDSASVEFDPILNSNVFEIKVKDYADFKTFHDSLTQKYETNKKAYEELAQKSTDTKAKDTLVALEKAYKDLDSRAKQYFDLKNKKAGKVDEKDKKPEPKKEEAQPDKKINN